LFGDTGNGSRSFFLPKMPNKHHRMKQNQTVTLPVSGAKESALVTWCEKENQLFSCVLESVVTNRQVCLMAHASLAFMALAGSAFKKLFQKVCGLKNNPHICRVKHQTCSSST
jgi:hypothetical protein